MGSAQSYIMSPEGALTALVMAGAIGLGYTQLSGSTDQPAITGPPPEVGASEDAVVAKPATKKGKKKSSKASAGEVSEAGSATKSKEPQIVEKVIPGQFDDVTPTPMSDTPQPPPTKKSKKKKKGKTVEQPPSEPESAPVSSAIDYLSESSIKEAGNRAKKQQPQGGEQQPSPKPSSSGVTLTPPQLTRPLQQSMTSIDTDGSWTRVGRGKGKSSGGASHSAPQTSTTTSDAATSPTADSSPVTGLSTAATLDEDRGEEASFLLNVNERERDSGDNHRRTLAEKLLPKPRKTGVDDMLEVSDYPNLARVIRVQPLPNEKPATGFSWADYEDVGEHDADGEDDGWDVVTNKRSKRTSPSTSSSQPHAATSTAQKAPETLTKRQRQNLQKREKEKAAKSDAEAQRLAALSKHKREAEKARMVEQAGKTSAKTASGGMKATVDERGKLVWE